MIEEDKKLEQSEENKPVKSEKEKNSDGDDLIAILNGVELEDKDSEQTPFADILEDSKLTKEDSDEAEAKLKSILNAASVRKHEEPVNPGSGDLDDDLANNYQGRDAILSEPLTRYVANTSSKSAYGLSRHILGNFELMGLFRQFLGRSFDSVFGLNQLAGLDPEERENFYVKGFSVFKELFLMNSKTILTLNEHRAKYEGGDTENDRLAMLIGAIPSDKLAAILEEISYGRSDRQSVREKSVDIDIDS